MPYEEIKKTLNMVSVSIREEIDQLENVAKQLHNDGDEISILLACVPKKGMIK